MGHPSSFREAVFIPPGRCTKKNFHASHRAPNDIHCKPQHVTKRTVQRTLVILSSFEADNILVVLLFQLQLHQNIPFSPCCRNNHHMTAIKIQVSLSSSHFIPVLQYFPQALEARAFPKMLPGSSKQQTQYLSFSDWKYQVSSAH